MPFNMECSAIFGIIFYKSLLAIISAALSMNTSSLSAAVLRSAIQFKSIQLAPLGWMLAQACASFWLSREHKVNTIIDQPTLNPARPVRLSFCFPGLLTFETRTQRKESGLRTYRVALRSTIGSRESTTEGEGLCRFRTGNTDEAFGNAEVERFNLAASARREEKARLLENQKAQARKPYHLYIYISISLADALSYRSSKIARPGPLNPDQHAALRRIAQHSVRGSLPSSVSAIKRSLNEVAIRLGLGLFMVFVEAFGWQRDLEQSVKNFGLA